jgi:hypothetical protein
LSTTDESRPAGRLSRVLPLLLLLLVVACSDSKKSAPDPAKDQQAAQDALLRPSDVIGYTETSATAGGASSDAPASNDPIASCVQQATGLDLSALTGSRTAQAKRTLAQGAGVSKSEIESSIEVYRDDTLLSKEVEALTHPDVQACVKTAFQNSFGSQDVDLPDLSITVHPLEGVGDDGVTIRVQGSLLTPGLTASFASDVAFVRAGRASISATVTTFNHAPDAGLAENAAKAMLKRLHL